MVVWDRVMPRSAIIWTRSAEAQFKCDVPSHTQNDDLLVKVPSLEQILCRGRFRHPGSYRRIPSLSTVCTRTPGRTGRDSIFQVFGQLRFAGQRNTWIVSRKFVFRCLDQCQVLGAVVSV